MFRSALRAPGTAASAPVVALRDVRKVYGRGEGAVVALDGVSAVLSLGSFTAITGPSGSGKSTFLNVAAGLDRPTSGSVVLGDTDLARLSERRLTILRRERIGLVFQAFNLLPSLTVAQNIALPLRLDGRRRAGADRRRPRGGRVSRARADPHHIDPGHGGVRRAGDVHRDIRRGQHAGLVDPAARARDSADAGGGRDARPDPPHDRMGGGDRRLDRLGGRDLARDRGGKHDPRTFAARALLAKATASRCGCSGTRGRTP